jgi:tetratricopeptide (TPR) repeat protein
MNYNASADFYYTKYKCEMKIRQYQPALNDIAHAIVLTRTEPVYYAEMASLQLRVNKLEDAVKTCDLALTIKGADQISDLFIIKGIALCELKKTTEGLEALKKAQELGDNRAEGLIKKYGK